MEIVDAGGHRIVLCGRLVAKGPFAALLMSWLIDNDLAPGSRLMEKTIQGVTVPALGLGTWQLTGQACRRGVLHALDLGYRHIDTAQYYGNEEEIGVALQETDVHRSDIFLSTKIARSHLAPEAVRSSFESSLQKLQTGYVDLLLIHWPREDIPLESTLDAMMELREQGKARQIGVSNFTPALLARATDHAPIFAIQVEYHPFLSQDSVLKIARSRGLLFIAYSPLARGSVVERNGSPRRALKALKRSRGPFQKVRNVWRNLRGWGPSLLRRIGTRHNKTPAQVTLRWLIQQENVVAIPKAASADHREENIDIFDFELSSEELNEIHDLAQQDRRVDPGIAPEWE